jgi:hypothetical protein
MKYFKLPGHEHPQVNHFEGTNVACFEDGTKAEVDVVNTNAYKKLDHIFVKFEMKIIQNRNNHINLCDLKIYFNLSHKQL